MNDDLLEGAEDFEAILNVEGEPAVTLDPPRAVVRITDDDGECPPCAFVV